LILPGAVPVFNVILLQNYIKTLPDAIAESASIDGAGHWRTLFQIILPLCAPSLATLCLFVAVGNWNAWFDGMLYINDNAKFPLQTYLRTLIVEVNMDQMSDAEDLAKLVATTGANTAKIFIAMVPILCVYPFVQKYFVKGIVHGSVKE
jgi:putative aldouronate transport system permease protein